MQSSAQRASLKALVAPLASPGASVCRCFFSCVHALPLENNTRSYNDACGLPRPSAVARSPQYGTVLGRLELARIPKYGQGGVRTWASFAQVQSVPTIDPFLLVKGELNSVSTRIRSGIVSEIPALQQAASYFFQRGSEGKQLRPSICLLLSSALSMHPPSDTEVSTPDLRPVAVIPTEARRRQQRIAEIAELIHVASLLHDDVIDDADARRGKPALNLVLGNKLAILAGDFLLARASMTLASLENTAVVSLMSQILEDLVSGEVLQATAPQHELSTMELYLKKTYLKTASLMANACKSAAVLSDGSSAACDAAFQYGKQLGLAFQVVDDILDFTSRQSFLGKPALGDVKAGVITCPVLFAAEEHPELVPMIKRKFKCAGDIEHAVHCVNQSRAIEKSRELAAGFVDQALACVDDLGPCPSEHAKQARDSLRGVCEKVRQRMHA